MPHQDFYQDRPFMAKEIFDQVSAVMWGQNALDYQTNYIAPRANWNNSDIREESLYFAGLSHGLRHRGAPKPSQNVMYQDNNQVQPRYRVDEYHIQLPPLGQQLYPACRRYGAGSSAFQSRRTSKYQPTHLSGRVCRFGIPSLSSGVQQNECRPAPPSHALSAYHQPEPQHNTHANTYGYYRNTVHPGNEPHMLSSLSVSRANMGQPTQEYNLCDTTARSTVKQEPANVATAQSKGRKLPGPFGTLSAPDGRGRSVDLTDAHTPQCRSPAPLHYLTSGPLVNAREENDALASTVEDQLEESFEKNFPQKYTPFIKEETSSDGDFD